MPAETIRTRFNRYSKMVDDRFGQWPTWKKLVVFMPILVVLSAILVAFLDLIGLGLTALQVILTHH